MEYPFTEQEVEQAYKAWGCNCGPAALAFALQIPLEDVRGQIPGFDERRYTNPTMMRQALRNLGQRWTEINPDKAHMFGPSPSLVRVQWCGPWTEPGANPKWAYRQTHWIATFRTPGRSGDLCWVFDCNGGVRTFAPWLVDVVPAILQGYPRANGEWFPTHIFRLEADAS